MKRNAPIRFFLLLIPCMFLLGTFTTQAQRRADLIQQIDTLQAKVRSLQTSLSESQAREKASLAEAASYETQVNELKDANATLLQNLGNFADVSNKSSQALNQALASLNSRERQLKGIQETMGKHDSTIITLLTDAKRLLGESARLKVASGSLVISAGLTELFGSDTAKQLTEGGGAWVARVAELARLHPEMGLTVEGLSMVGDLDLAAEQATAVMNALNTSLALPATPVFSRGRDGNFSEGVDILVHPNYRQFYQTVRQELKN
jgi:hypothetical protein